MAGESLNDNIFAKFPLLSKIQTLSHKLLVKQTSIYHHCNWHAIKPICSDLQVILSSLLKTEDILLKTKDGCTFWSFIEKTSMKQDPKPRVCSNFRWTPQQRHLVARNGTNLGPVDLDSDISPWQWHLVAKNSTNLGPDDVSSDVPLVEASSGQE